jgi:transposase
MIASGVVVYVSRQPVDFRKGAASLMALVRDGGLDPFNGALYVFRSKRTDRVRIVWWDGSGVSLYSKVLEEMAFAGRQRRRRASVSIMRNSWRFWPGWIGRRSARRQSEGQSRQAEGLPKATYVTVNARKSWRFAVYFLL